MGTLQAKSTIETHFINNWTDTSIQFDGVPFNYESLDSWISIVYSPALNSNITQSGLTTPSMVREAVLKVFCYAKTVPLAFSLSDSVQSFINNVQIGNVIVGVGFDSTANNLQNGFFEVPIKFITKYYE